MNEILKYKLAHQQEELTYLVQHLEPQFLLQNHVPSKWSIHEQLAHLGRYQEIFRNRIVEMLENDNPLFGRYKAEEDAEFVAWKRKSTAMILADYQVDRAELAIWINSFSANQLKKKGTHPKLGEMNVEEWIQFFTLHESHHIYAIFWLVREFG